MGQFVFSYQIEITNNSPSDVSLDALELFVFDSLAKPQNVQHTSPLFPGRVISKNQTITEHISINLRSALGEVKGRAYLSSTTNEKVIVGIRSVTLEYYGKKN